MPRHEFPPSFTESMPAPQPFDPTRKQEVTFTQLISPEEIDDRIRVLAAAVAEAYKPLNLQRPPVFLMGINSGAQFGLELAQALTEQNPDLEPTMDTIAIKSQGTNTHSGSLRINKPPSQTLAGRHVLLVEGAIDLGTRVRNTHSHVRSLGAASIAVASLVTRQKGVTNLTRTPPPARATISNPDPVQPKAYNVQINFPAFAVPDTLVAGHGLDVNGARRFWPGLYAPEGEGYPREYSLPEILGLPDEIYRS